MKPVITRSALLAVLALSVMSAGMARAQLSTQPIAKYFGDISAVPEGVDKGVVPNSPMVLTAIYDNSTAARNFVTASADPLAKWGDELFTTGTGLLSTNTFTISNFSPNPGPPPVNNLLTATVNVTFYDAVSSALLGGYNTNIDFGAGLPPGSFATVSVTGIDPLLIILNVTDILVIQTVTAKTGTATTLGIASRNPPSIGTSPGTMYIQESGFNGGIPGFYAIGDPPIPANPGYQIQVTDLPVPVARGTWGRIKHMYR